MNYFHYVLISTKLCPKFSAFFACSAVKIRGYFILKNKANFPLHLLFLTSFDLSVYVSLEAFRGYEKKPNQIQFYGEPVYPELVEWVEPQTQFYSLLIQTRIRRKNSMNAYLWEISMIPFRFDYNLPLYV